MFILSERITQSHTTLLWSILTTQRLCMMILERWILRKKIIALRGKSMSIDETQFFNRLSLCTGLWYAARAARLLDRVLRAVSTGIWNRCGFAMCRCSWICRSFGWKGVSKRIRQRPRCDSTKAICGGAELVVSVSHNNELRRGELHFHDRFIYKDRAVFGHPSPALVYFKFIFIHITYWNILVFLYNHHLLLF